MTKSASHVADPNFRLVNYPSPLPEDIKRGELPWAVSQDGHKPIKAGDRIVMKSGRVYQVCSNGKTLMRVK